MTSKDEWYLRPWIPRAIADLMIEAEPRAFGELLR
jgi:hypothetical protein